MRLLNSRSKQLELLHHRLAPYAIVSHRWGDESEEVLFTDIGEQARAEGKGKGYHKLLGSCAQAMQDGLNYVWLDTCCIDKSNSTELGEAINSMYKWYQKSEVCYAYLHDVSDLSEFTKSDWFSRGWTLQELIAPKVLKFFTKDWECIGTREELVDLIADHTGISDEILGSGKIPQDITISQKMFWAAKRETVKVEDKAYSLLGILGVSMVPNYGIDDDAFEDLQHKLITKYADQTLFAWYYDTPQPEDVEMADANPAPDPAPDPIPESVEGDTGILPNTPTGFLASSPSQYRASYEISENDFRKNYVDRIREHSYRSQFSITNNLVRISLPIKHIKGQLWKAVLRCSFEPPDGDKPQRPLVIYLKEIGPLKYIRVHLVRGEAEEEGEGEGEGDDQTDDMNSAPGSLEQLSDEESKLEGYSLRDIDVVSRYGECPSDDRQRPPTGDPDSLPEPTEAERIAQLPRHPPGVKTTNVVVCGEPGVAAGRVINIITGDTIIKPLTDYDREMMAVTVIDTTLRSKNIRIFYTIGPRDPYLDLENYQTAIRHLYHLVRQVKDAGGIHLIWLCMVGSRVTRAVETNYRLFYDYICRRQVPTMLIVTGLGKMRGRMEDWWDKHKTVGALRAMCFLDHACITVLRGEDDAHERRYQNSTETIQGLLVGFVERLEATTTREVYCPEDLHRWFVLVGSRAMELLLPGHRKTLKREGVEKMLKEGIDDLGEVEASCLAQQIFDERAAGMERTVLV